MIHLLNNNKNNVPIFGGCSQAMQYEQATYHMDPEMKSDVWNVTMAGLMHDLGHGPFSHLFDRGVIPTLLSLKGRKREDIGHWEHEKASAMLFDHMIDKCGLDIEKDGLDKDTICSLIDGKPLPKHKDK
jgi:HD superfamily phosphohydrolase